MNVPKSLINLYLEHSGMYKILVSLIPLLISFFTTYYLVKKWIPVAKEFGLVGKDMHKLDKREVAESGGIWVIIGITFGLLFYVFLKKYILNTETHLVEILSIIIIALLSGLLGFIDDLLGWKKGLKPWQKPLFTLPIALPLVVIKAGYTKITLPFIGTIDLGLLYPLVLVPVGIMGAANGFNMIAGYNGLEALMGIVLFFFLFLKFYELKYYWLAYISLIIIFSLLAFFYFNKYPAKVFPGDSLTYSIGALYASLVILGNIEKYGVLLFSLYFLELLLFIRGLLNGVYKENFGKVQPDGSLIEPYDKIYSVTHLAIRILRKIKGKVYEWEVVYFIVGLQILIGAVVYLLT